MPVSSAQISGLIGGQQAMFSNNMAFSQQLSGIYGTGPGGGMQSMQNPYPSYGVPGYGQSAGDAGVGIASGFGSALPAMATGASIAGGFGLLGGAGKMLDPFTTGASAFARSSGLAGSFAGTGGGFGGFARGLGVAGGRLAGMGAMGGAGALAAGVGGAALAAAPMLAIGAGVSAVGSHISQGAQTVGQVEQIAQQYGPQYGQSGGRPGGQMARSQIQGMVDVLHELASDSVIGSVKDMTSLMDKFARSGQLTGVTDAASFKQRFSSLVKQVDSVAQILGTSLEEAAPMLQQMNRMGMWSPKDVMGTAFAMKTVGAQAAPQMMQTMQAGAQMAHARGGDIGAGAKMGRRTFMEIQAATRTGSLSGEELMNLTGGVGGAEGQRMLATQWTGAIGNMGNTPVGNLMLAGMGEIEGKGEDRRFTGKIDKDILEQFTSGQIGIGELQKRGQGRINNRNLSAGFMMRRKQIGQDMGAEGGLEAILQAVSQGSQYGGFEGEGEDVQARLLQMMTGVDERTALAWAEMGKDMQKNMSEKRRRARDTIDDTFRQLDRRMNHSWQGFKDAMGQRAEGFWRPFEEFGGRLATQVGEDIDSFVNESIFGYQPSVDVSTEERRRILSQGGPQVTAKQLGLEGGIGTGLGSASLNSSMREGGVYGAVSHWRGGRRGVAQGNVMASLGMETRLSMGGPEAGEVQLMQRGAGKLHADEAKVEIARRRAISRGESRSLESLGTDAEDPDLIKGKMALNSIMLDPRKAKAMRVLKERWADNPAQYQKAVLAELRKVGAGDAIDNWVKKRGPRAGMEGVEALDFLAAADTLAGGVPIGTNLEWERTGAMVGGIPRDPDKLKEMYNEGISEAANILHQGAMEQVPGAEAVQSVIEGFSKISGPFGKIATKLAGYVGGAISGAMQDVPSLGAIKDALGDPDIGPALNDWIGGDKGEDGEFMKMVRGDAGTKDDQRKANQIFELMGSVTDEQKEALSASMGKSVKAKRSIVQIKAQEQRGAIARKERLSIGKLRGKVSGEVFDEYESILKLQESGEFDKQQEAMERMASLSGTIGAKDREAIGRGGGSFGRAMAVSGAAAKKIKGGMSADEWEKTRGNIAGMMGFDLFDVNKEAGEYMRQAVKDGLTSDEAEKLRGMVTTMGARIGGTEGKSGMEATQQQLMAQLQQYTQANSQFVSVVGEAISKITDIDTEELRDILPNLKKKITNPAEAPE